MAELKENLELVIPCQKLLIRTNAHKDKFSVENISLSPNDAATLAWLGNQPNGTELTIEIKITPAAPPP